MLALLLLACGADPDIVVGCWQQTGTARMECFHPDGRYTFQSAKSGLFEGTWRRLGDSVEVKVDEFPPDVYAARKDGTDLVLVRADRPEKRLAPATP
ncbi:MAG: hypothetical protein H6734_18550 [Alphaproteobacteria bacterium]|nr:hypothetical protein [Alphaproteobacteria bacterium]